MTSLPQTCRWSTLPCVCCRGRWRPTCRCSTSSWGRTTTSAFCRPSSTRCWRALWPSSMPHSSLRREPRYGAALSAVDMLLSHWLCLNCPRQCGMVSESSVNLTIHCSQLNSSHNALLRIVFNWRLLILLSSFLTCKDAYYSFCSAWK